MAAVGMRRVEGGERRALETGLSFDGAAVQFGSAASVKQSLVTR